MEPGPANVENASPEELLRAENAELRARLEEAEETLRAIRSGEVEALIVETDRGPQVFSLTSAEATSNELRGEILAQVSDAVIAVDREDRVTYLNTAAERQYRVKATEVLGRNLAEIYTRHWPNPEEEAAAWAALREHGEWHGETLQRTYDGRELLVESSLTTLRDASGAETGTVSAIRDITARKRDAEQFQRVSSLLDTLLRTAPIGFCFLDRELRFVRINDRLAAINGISAKAHLGRHVSEIVPMLADTVREVTTRILATGQPLLNHEFYGETPGAPGVMRSWSESWYPVRDRAGEVLGFGVLIEETTERKLTEEALGRLAAIVESSGDAIISEDLDGQVTSWNWGAEQIFGYSAAEIIGTPLMRLVPEALQAAEQEQRRKLVTGEHGGTFETIRLAKGGRRFPASVTVAVLKDPSGRVIGTSRVLRDITERHRVEEKARERAEQLDLLARASHRLIDCAVPNDELLTGIFGDIAQLIGVESFYHFTANHPERCLHLQTAGGVGKDERRLFGSIKFGDLLCGRVAETRERLIVEDLQHSTTPGTEVLRAARARSFAGFPLLDSRDVLLGTVAFVSRQRTHFREGDVQMVETICEQVAVTMERARLLGELQETQQRTRLAAEATGVGIWEWNVGSGLIRWDAQMFRLYGIAPTADGFVQYRDWSGAVLPEELAENERILQDTARRGGRSRREFRIRRRDGGDVRDIEAVETARTNAQGKTEWVVGTNLDITTRKRAEAELRTSETRLALGTEVAELALAEVDYATGLYHLTARAAQLFGLGDAAMVVPRSTVYATFYPADREAVTRLLAEAQDPTGAGRLATELRVVWPAGETRWLSVRKQVFFTGEGAAPRPLRAMLAALDVTEGKTAAEAVRASEEFVRGVLNSLPEHVAVLDEHGVITAVNEPWELFARNNDGHSRFVAAGVNYLEVCRRSSEDGDVHATETLAQLKELLAGQRESCVVEYPGHAPDREQWFLMHAKRLLHGPRGLILSHVDITERKRAEAALEVARQQAEAANKAKDHFLSALSHELRTPLTPVLMATSAILDEGVENPMLREDLEMILRNVKLEVRLIDDLLDVTRITHGKLALDAKPCDLHEIVRHALRVCEDTLKKRRIEVVLRLDAASAVLRGDPARLQQVIWNLLSNAAKFSPEAGRIEIVSELHETDWLRVSVRDHGRGIIPENLALLFNAFEQLGTATTQQFGGLGLGLAICRGVIQGHGGRIWAESEGAGQGATFFIELPILRD